MCVIIWSPKGKIPINHVTRAMAAHPDGWGFSVAARSGGVRTYRSTDREEFLTAWNGRILGPVLFHARWATHGRICRENCHPFRVRGHGLVMAHNGVLKGFGSSYKSDTRDFIEKLLEPMPRGFIEDESIVTAIEEFITPSKLIFLDKTGTAVIFNEYLGVWRNGLWYSNTSVL